MIISGLMNKAKNGYDATFERVGISDDQYFRGGEFLGEEFPLKVDVSVHPNDNGIIVVNYPGFNGDIDGYNDKYKALGEHVCDKIGAVIRTDNPHLAGFNYEKSVQDHLRSVIEYALENSQEIAGKPKDEIIVYLMGFSAGSSAIAAVAHEYPQVTNILLMAPSGDAGQESVTNGLNKYSGKCSIIVGEDDEVVGKEAGEYFSSLATSASELKSVVLPDCDHQFRGEKNGRIMSAAPIWAFSETGKNSPDPNDGVKLYD